MGASNRMRCSSRRLLLKITMQLQTAHVHSHSLIPKCQNKMFVDGCGFNMIGVGAFGR